MTVTANDHVDVAYDGDGGIGRSRTATYVLDRCVKFSPATPHDRPSCTTYDFDLYQYGNRNGDPARSMHAWTEQPRGGGTLELRLAGLRHSKIPQGLGFQHDYGSPISEPTREPNWG